MRDEERVLMEYNGRQAWVPESQAQAWLETQKALERGDPQALKAQEDLKQALYKRLGL